jgi:hypothetical protein
MASLGVLAKFFGIARDNCCNYIPKGPYGRQDFCWTTGQTCLLKDDEPCRYFGEAVITCKPFRDRGLPTEWEELQQGVGTVRNKICTCGDEYRVTSPRQRQCPTCNIFPPLYLYYQYQTISIS